MELKKKGLCLNDTDSRTPAYLTDTPLMESAKVVRSSLNEMIPASSTSKMAIVLVTTLFM